MEITQLPSAGDRANESTCNFRLPGAGRWNLGDLTLCVPTPPPPPTPHTLSLALAITCRPNLPPLSAGARVGCLPTGRRRLVGHHHPLGSPPAAFPRLHQAHADTRRLLARAAARRPGACRLLTRTATWRPSSPRPCNHALAHRLLAHRPGHRPPQQLPFSIKHCSCIRWYSPMPTPSRSLLTVRC
jgi:hypothetical protein